MFCNLKQGEENANKDHDTEAAILKNAKQFLDK